MTRVLLFFIFTTFVGGCAVSPSAPTFAEAPNPDLSSGRAILYLFREHAEPTAWSATLSVDDKEQTSLPEKGFSWIYVSPGKHNIKITWPLLAGMPKDAFEREFEKNKVYVFEIKGRVSIVGMRSPTSVVAVGETSLLSVEPDVAKATMSKCCRYVAPANQSQ